MPYKCEKKKIPAELNRRIKITQEIADNMRAMYQEGFAIKAIAREFNVHPRTVKRHIVPGYADAENKKRKQEKVWLKYYDREQRRLHMQNHRHYKRELELAGKLAE